MKVPLIKADLPTWAQVEGPFREILENGRITNFGKYVTQFEDETAAYLGTHTATTSSGTMALLFALQALGLKPGGKVILPSFTFMATAQAVLYAGGIPLFCEIQDDLTASASDIEQLLETHSDVSAVLAVHLYGLPAPVQALQEMVQRASRKRGKAIRLLYDAAHAFGSKIGSQRVGTFGDAEVFSLSVTKALVTVEGGLVSSKNLQLIELIRKMRNYGIESRYDAMHPGMNGKMSEFHAIVGLKNLKRLEEILAIRSQKAQRYAEQIREKTTFSVLTTPKGITHTYKDFSVLAPPALKAQRDAIIQFLDQEGVESRAYFSPPVHEQSFFRRFADRPLPVTEDRARRVVTLPFFTTITGEQMDTVVAALQKAERKFS